MAPCSRERAHPALESRLAIPVTKFDSIDIVFLYQVFLNRALRLETRTSGFHMVFPCDFFSTIASGNRRLETRLQSE